MYENNFQDRMQAGKDAAHERRQRGLPDGNPHKSWVVERPRLSGLDALEAYYHQWRKDIHYNAYLAVEWALFGDDWQDLCEF